MVQHGRVYVINKDQVLKVTIRGAEAQICAWLLQNHSNIPSLPRIFAVWSISTAKEKPLFLIVRENLKDFCSYNARKFNIATVGLENKFYARAGENYWCNGLKQAMQKVDPRDITRLEEMARAYRAIAGTTIRVYDCHEKNLGLRQDGTLVIRDLSSGHLISDIPGIPVL